MLNKLPHPIAVVAHDAGGANQLIAQIQANGLLNHVQAFMEGPAKHLWKKAFPAAQLCASIEEALDKSQCLIAGTGWATDIEFNALKLAKQLGIPSYALLDHWTNYGERFSRHGQTVYPDEILVVDEYAAQIAKDTFPNRTIRQLNDCYLAAQVAQIPPNTDHNREILYVLEPIRNNWGGTVPGEFQALDYFVSKITEIKGLAGATLVLRPHPSEDPEKYISWSQRQHQIDITFDQSPSLSEAISRAHWIAGCESYALIVGLASERTVFCTLPPWAPDCRLPHQGLIHIKNLHI